MAHSGVKPIWKYSWKPEGYGVETLEFDATSLKVGSIVRLPHSFFRSREFVVVANNAELTVGLENKTLTGKEDIVLRMYDAKLSQLGDSPIYRTFEIASKRAKALLTIKVNFIADVIDPEDIGQQVNQEADVIHNSIAVKDASAEKLFAGEATLGTLRGDWGVIDPDKAVFTARALELFGASIEGGRVSISEPLELKTGEKGALRFNQELQLFEIWNTRANKFVPIILSHEDARDIPPGSIAIVSGDDPAAQSYVDWLRVDPAKKNLLVPGLITEGLEIDSNSGLIKIPEFSWAGHTLRILDDGTLDIDGLLQINKAQGTVTIGGLNFNKTLLSNIKKFDTKLAELEKKLEGKE